MRKTICKITGILFMVSALVLTQIPAIGTKASSSVKNGFMMDGTKLVEYTGTDTDISVPKGVKTIGAEAFSGYSALERLTLPQGLETIESGAFNGCTQLKNVVLPDGCKSLENGAFADCDKLEYVYMPASLVALGTSVFAGCDRLKDVSIDSKNQYFVCEDGVIYNNKLSIIYQYLAGYTAAEYSMPNTVEEIKKYAFWGCSNLKEVKVSSLLTEIGDFTFSNASGLETIVIPYSVRAIRRKAFEDCINLKYTTIPVSVTTIDDTAFDGCYNLRIRAEEGSTAEEFFLNLEANKAAGAEYEDSLSQNAVNPHWQEDKKEQAEAVTSSVIPYASDVEHYVEWDVDSPGVLGRTKIVSNQAVVLFSTDKSELQGGDGVSSNHLTVDNDTLEKKMVDGNTIGYKAFYGDKNLTHIQIPDSVDSIADFAFARSGLQELVIPSGVNTIGNAAFYHCDDLAAVSIPSSVTELGEDAFTGTKWLNDWFSDTQYSDFMIVGDGILAAYKGSESNVIIPDGVKQIGAGAFRNHSEILQVSVPESVTRICEDAFYNCSSLKNVTGMNSVSAIEDGAFYLCPLTTARIPASVREIGVSAFGGTGLTDSVIFLGTKLPAFTYCDSATRLSGQRHPVFDGISAAVVDASIKLYDLKDTVLDSSLPGFSGILYNISSGYDAKLATPVISTYAEEDTSYPDTIYVYGDAYRVNQSVEIYYADKETDEADKSLQGMMVVDHSKLNKSDISVSQSNSAVDLNGYHLYISDAGLGTKELTKAIQDNYGEMNAANSFFMDLSMYDPSDSVPIKYLGKNTLTVTIPVPTELIGKELCIVTLDRNKKPEILLGSLSVKDERQFISFDISHFSPYAIYAPEGELKDSITEKWENSSNTYGLDDTPDTGDYVNIRWILLVGLFASGGFLLLLGFGDFWHLKKK